MREAQVASCRYLLHGFNLFVFEAVASFGLTNAERHGGADVSIPADGIIAAHLGFCIDFKHFDDYVSYVTDEC